MKFFRLGFVGLSVGALAACSGSISSSSPDDPGASGDSSGDDDTSLDDSEVIAQPGECARLGNPADWQRPVARLRRLTRIELRHAIEDLTGTAWSGPDLPDDIDPRGLDRDVQFLSIGTDFLSAFLPAAESAAQKILSVGPNKPSCAGGDKACARGFATALADRAFRRTPTDAEVDDLMESFAVGNDVDNATGLAFIAQRVLLSPHFLYLAEDGVRMGDVSERPLRLSPDHIAEQLSFLLWSAPPDEQLRKAARDGFLDDADGVRAQAERLLAAPRGQEAAGQLFERWLGLGEVMFSVKDKDAFPGFDADIKADMVQDATRTLTALLLEGGTAADILTTPDGFMTSRLRNFLQIPASADKSNDATRTQPPGRHGLLTMPAFLAPAAGEKENSTVLRGKHAVERVLCASVPAPPADADLAGADPGFAPGLTLRERMERHAKDPACAGCHNVFEPVGYALEGYDAVGRLRDMDGGKPINDTVELDDFQGITGTFDGIAELAPALAQLPAVETCFVATLAKHAVGTAPSQSGACLAFDGAGVGNESSLMDLILGYVSGPAFLERQTSTMGGQ